MRHSARAPTPVLDAYRELWNGLDTDKSMLTAYVVSVSAKLDFPDPADAPKADALRAFLAEIQPTISSLIALSRQDPEPFPPHPDLDKEAMDAHRQHPKAWMQDFTRLLWADTSRVWDAGQPDAAAERIGATLRIAHAMISQQDPLTRTTGGTILTIAAKKLQNLAEVGLGTRTSPAARQSLVETLRRFDASDPARAIANWENDARSAVAWARIEFSGRSAGRKLAGHIDTWGMDDVSLDMPELDAESRALIKMIEGTIPIRKDPQREADVSSRRVQQAIDEAEKMIGPIAAGLQSSDPVAALTPWMDKARADPTQIARLILGAPHASFVSSRRTAASLRDALQRLQP